MEGFDLLGVDDVGLDWGSAIQAASGLATGLAASADADKAQAKLTGDDKKKTDAAIAADIAAANAAAKADVSGQLKSGSAAADAAAAKVASDAQDRAGLGLSPDGSAKRAAAADAQLANAQKNSLAKPADGYQTALVKAWGVTANKAHNINIVANADDGRKKGKGGESWWTRRVLGPVPGYGVAVGGVGLLGGIGYFIKKIILK